MVKTQLHSVMQSRHLCEAERQRPRDRGKAGHASSRHRDEQTSHELLNTTRQRQWTTRSTTANRSPVSFRGRHCEIILTSNLIIMQNCFSYWYCERACRRFQRFWRRWARPLAVGHWNVANTKQLTVTVQYNLVTYSLRRTADGRRNASFVVGSQNKARLHGLATLLKVNLDLHEWTWHFMLSNLVSAK